MRFQKRISIRRTIVVGGVRLEAYSSLCLSAATVHLQPTVRPVGEALAEAEGWRMHRDRLFMKHIGNKPRGVLATDRVSRHLPEMYVVSEADAAAIREAYETGGRVVRCHRATPPLPRHHGQRQGAGAGEGYRWVATAAKPSTEGSQAIPEGEGGCRCPCKVASLLPLASARYQAASFLGRPRPLFPLTPSFTRCTGTGAGFMEPGLRPRPLAAAIFDRRSE